MKDRREITVELPDPIEYGEGDGDGEICVSLPVFIERLKDRLESVPVEYRQRAVFSVRGYGDYVSVYLSASYSRPETDEEVEERKQAEMARKAKDEAERAASEKVQYERLKAKFG